MNNHSVKTEPLYQPNGVPAYNWIKILQNPQPGLTLVINGDNYVYGADFVGLSAPQATRSLCEAINADQSSSNEVNPSNTNFSRVYYAEMSGQYIVIKAKVPGAAGNSLTLTTSNVNIATIGGATFMGGVNGSAAAAGGGVLTDGGGAIAVNNTAQQIFAALPSRIYLFVQNQSAHNMYVNFGAVATQDGHSILLLPNGSVVFESNFVPNGLISIIGTTATDAYAAKQA